MADMYNTVNGQKSVGQMQTELQEAGWGGGEDVASAYARTTGGAVTQGAPSNNTSPTTPTAPGTPAVPPKGADLEAARLLLDQAQNAAYNAYLNARLNLETDAQAFSQAQQAFTNHITEASLTGTYNGQPTLAAQQQQASISGRYTDYNAFAQRDPQAKAFVAQNPSLLNPAYQQQLLQTRGYVFYPGEDASTLTLAGQQQQQNTANDYLKLIAGLRGPQDYGQYLKVLASTPGGIKDLVASAAGQYVPGGGTTGAQPTPASLGGLVGQATAGAGQMMGGTASPQQAQYADYMATASGLPAPNQISPAAYNQYTTTQKQLLSGMYEAQGYNPQDVTDLYKQSLPKYAYSGSTTGTVKLQ